MSGEGSRVELRTGLVDRVVGREPELAELERFLVAAAEPTVVVSGAPGIGKSTVWDGCVEAARALGFCVLAARAAEPEVRLTFVALADLLAEVDFTTLGTPTPARRALEVAVLRAEPDGPPPDPFAVAMGFLEVMQSLAAAGPALIAVDDLPWLDPASAEVLCFAARRLGGRGARFVLARRTGKRPDLEGVLEPFGVRHVELDGLTLGATRVLLAQRLELKLPRRVLARLHDIAQGNPLFVLELGRALGQRGIPEIGADLPVPERIDDLFGDRVSALSPLVRRLLLAVALSGNITRAELSPFVESGVLDDAVQDGLVRLEGDRVHASHPLLAATVRSQADARERRNVHLLLAQHIAGADSVRLRHRALAAETPDRDLAQALATEASAAVTRGAGHDAVELADYALRLTPAVSQERPERLLALAEHLELVGELPRMARLLDRNLEGLDAKGRARAHLLLAEAAVSSDEHERHLDLALAESGDDAELRALSLSAKSFFAATISLAQLERGEAWAREALRLSKGANVDVQQRALHALAVTRIIRGRPIDDLVAVADGAADIYASSLDMLVAIRLGFRGHVAAARRLLRDLLELADRRGEGRSHAVVLQHLCRIEVLAGMTQDAARLLEEADGWSTLLGAQADVWQLWLGAYLAGVRGARADAYQQAAAAAAAAAESGTPGDRLDVRVVCGLASLLNGDMEGAAGHYRVVWDHLEREGVDDPGAFPVAPDMVEALVALGEKEAAEAVVRRLEQLAVSQNHPWGLATVLRCRGLLHSSGDRSAAGVAMLAEAASAYEEIELHFDAARSMLALGRLERRLRRWGDARKTLEQATARFEEIDADGWAADARSELTRVGGRRRRAPGELTPAERQIVELALGGLSNKEIAGRLVVSVHTVERHLSHVYAKLGVRSRTQLASRLGGSI